MKIYTLLAILLAGCGSEETSNETKSLDKPLKDHSQSIEQNAKLFSLSEGETKTVILDKGKLLILTKDAEGNFEIHFDSNDRNFTFLSKGEFHTEYGIKEAEKIICVDKNGDFLPDDILYEGEVKSLRLEKK